MVTTLLVSLAVSLPTTPHLAFAHTNENLRSKILATRVDLTQAIRT